MMDRYPPTHCCNPAFQYVTAEETKKSGYLAMRFARIVAAREVAEAENSIGYVESTFSANEENTHV